MRRLLYHSKSMCAPVADRTMERRKKFLLQFLRCLTLTLYILFLFFGSLVVNWRVWHARACLRVYQYYTLFVSCYRIVFPRSALTEMSASGSYSLEASTAVCFGSFRQ